MYGFTDAVGAVVEVEDGVTVLDAAGGAVHNDGFEEFVGFACVVAGAYCCHGVGGFFAFALHEPREPDFDALPAFVAVHDVVSPYDGRDLAESQHFGMCEEGFEVALSGLGIGVAAVAEEVDPDFFDAVVFCDFEEAEEVVDVAMDAAVADETTEMQPAVAVGGVCEALFDVFYVFQLVLLDRLVDADDILPHYSSGADVQVSNFGVAHQSFWETDGERRRFQLSVSLCGVGAGFAELVHDRSFRRGDGVAIGAGGGGGNTPAVNDDEDCFVCGRHVGGRLQDEKL